MVELVRKKERKKSPSARDEAKSENENGKDKG